MSYVLLWSRMIGTVNFIWIMLPLTLTGLQHITYICYSYLALNVQDKGCWLPHRSKKRMCIKLVGPIQHLTGLWRLFQNGCWVVEFLYTKQRRHFDTLFTYTLLWRLWWKKYSLQKTDFLILHHTSISCITKKKL